MKKTLKIILLSSVFFILLITGYFLARFFIFQKPTKVNPSFDNGRLPIEQSLKEKETMEQIKEITKEKIEDGIIRNTFDYDTIKHSHFGGGGNESTDFATMKEFGIHWLRVRVSQNPKGKFDGKYPIALEMRENPKTIPIDDYVKKAQENGLLLYMVIDPGGPPWSAKEFANFLKAIVERYDGDGVDDMPGLIYPIKHYEILNEVEISPYVKQNFTFEMIMDYIRESYRALKDACPDAKLANPSFVSSPGIIDNIISNGGDKYFDIFTYHSYDEYLEIDKILSYLENKGFGPNSANPKPIFITESSFSPVGPEDISQEEIARRLVRSYVYALAKGVSVLIPSEFKEMPYFRGQLALSCFVDKNGNKRPSFYAYKTLISKLDFFTSVEELAQYQYKFIVNNKPIYVLWGEGNIPSEITGKVKVTDIFGNERQIDTSKIILTDSPIFVEQIKK